MEQGQVMQKGFGSDLKWSLLALVVIILGLKMSGAGMAALTPLLRFAVPLVVVYLAYRFLKKKLAARFGDVLKKQFEAAMQAQQQQQGRGGPAAGGRNNAGVIDLCPKCGAYAQPGHKCAKK